MTKPVKTRARGSELSCACTATRKASRALTRYYEEVMSPSGLTACQFALLRALERNGPTLLRQLADELIMERTSVYRAVKPLVRDGLVRLRGRQGDGRVKEAVLSRAGHQRVGKALPYWRQAQKSFLRDFGGASWAQTVDQLRRIVDLFRVEST